MATSFSKDDCRKHRLRGNDPLSLAVSCYRAGENILAVVGWTLRALAGISALAAAALWVLVPPNPYRPAEKLLTVLALEVIPMVVCVLARWSLAKRRDLS